MVFDVSKEQSFENCAIWVDEIRTRSGREHIRGTRRSGSGTTRLLRGSRCCATVRAGALVANKTDLEDRVFGNARMRGQQFAQGYGLQYFETSAVRHTRPSLALSAGGDSRGRPTGQPIQFPLWLTCSLHARVQMNTEGVNETFDSIAKDFAQSYVEYTRRLGA